MQVLIPNRMNFYQWLLAEITNNLNFALTILVTDEAYDSGHYEFS